MEIPNLSTEPVINTPPKLISLPIIAIVIVLAITSGFWLSRLIPSGQSSKNTASNNQAGTVQDANVVSAESVKTKEDIRVGQSYGETGQTFKDTATGTIEKGSINGVGTHILNRPGGLDQRASLTSSTIDLDLFVGHKIEVKGETNSSSKTGWLMDVGIVKVLE